MNQRDHQYFAQSVDDVLQHLEVDPQQGLSPQEVDDRRDEYGFNRLQETQTPSAFKIILNQFTSMVVIILGVAGIVALVSGRFSEAIAIFAVILVNTLIGFVSEWKAIRSMEALRKLGEQTVRVRREGGEKEVASEEIVPGDIVLLEGGELIPADLRLVEAKQLRVNEAALTGESVPVNKLTDAVDEEAPLAERTCMLYKGTSVAEGSAIGVAVSTGMHTELGRISELAQEAEKEQAPLQKRLDALGGKLAWASLSIGVVVGVVGWLAGKDLMLMIETGIALGVAMIPEGLPIVATIALARGMWLMARRQALINRLTAVETLGSTRVIFTDKTGTLTENRMTLRRVVTPAKDFETLIDGNELKEIKIHDRDDKKKEAEKLTEDPLLRRILEIGVLCSNAKLNRDNDKEAEGDPTEIALLRAGRALGMGRDELLENKPEEREESFDPETMMMATFHQADEGLDVAVKGAPGEVLKVCTHIAVSDGREELSDDQREQWMDRSEKLAAEGLRLLAAADKSVDSTDVKPYENLRLVGLIGLLDPPREDVAKSIEACKHAGIKVIMVTGDQPATARAIGKSVGIVESDDALVMHGSEIGDFDDHSEEHRKKILETSIFARVSPEQKLNLIDVYQEHGDTVAMTGDGVNDAPALKSADIGVAMGKRGTDAARQVADMILKDDAFNSIEAAIQQGRIIFNNIRKSSMYMLCTNVAEILAVASCSLANAPLPLLPLQILYLNVISDVFPALALSVGKGSEDVMERPPRPRGESIITGKHWAIIGGWAFILSACVLGALALALMQFGFEQYHAVTISFMTLGIGKLWFTFNLRDPGTTFFHNDVVRNPWVWGAIALCIVLLALAVYLPGLSTVLQTRPLGWSSWGLVLGMSLIPFIAGQILRFYQRLRGA